MKRKTEVLMWICFILFFTLLFSQTAQGGDVTKKLPAMANLRKYGCTAGGPILTMNHKDPAGREHVVWEARVWASHQTPYEKKDKQDWKLWLGHYKSLEDGNKACMKWMKQIKKASARWKMGNRKRTLR